MTASPPASTANSAAGTNSSSKKEKNASTSSTGALFPVGPLGRRELRNALKNTVNPNQTIREFQQTHSLHTMISKAFQTNPIPPVHPHQTRQLPSINEETLDSDSVMAFLSHLNIPQYQIHKRITETLIQEVCEDIRKTVIPSTSTSQQPHQETGNASSSIEDQSLLDLLKSCWSYTITLPELRPIVWSILKQLGPQTPTPVLLALTEREDVGIKLKHEELYKPLSLQLKQLCWEVDWEHRLPNDHHNTPDPEQFLSLAQATLLYETLQADIFDYLQNPMLCDMANHPYVSTISERRLVTAQRRALTKFTAATATTAGGGKRWTTGKAVAHLRHLLSSSSSSAPDYTSTVASSSSTSYRPKLLYSVLSMVMALYSRSSSLVMGGAGHLHCTLVADLLLLSAGGPLPKAYNDVLALARTLDDVVNEGNVSDSQLFQIQSMLKLIFQPDHVGDTATTEGNITDVSEKPEASADTPTNATKRQWNRWIASGLAAMKESDPQQLFLNPVTDKIAPGYSSIINHPMSIRTMEEKLEQHRYSSVTEWEKDVTLMYKNCIQYNRGPAGAWFRNEASRQSKIFREEIFPPIRRLYQNEIAKRSFLGSESSMGSPSGDPTQHSGVKRSSQSLGGPEIVPLMPSIKKRKKEREEYIPSMPAIASMLLSDPFVVRILLARVLRELRRSVLLGQTIPCTHSLITSIFQLLHIIRWSKDICAMRGKKFFVPASGLEKDDEPTAYTSYTCLRVYTPLLLRLFLESELDRRTAQGGDLYPAVQSSSVSKIPVMPQVPGRDEHEEAKVAVTLIQGSLIHLCLPGNQTEASLATTFPKFAAILQGLSKTLLDDRLFFSGLQESLLKHKTKLPRSTRDAIVAAWLSWLQGSDPATAIVAPAHECLLQLLNAWFSLGNILLPRDAMIRFCTNTVEAVGPELFRTHWKSNAPEAFLSIKKQYKNMLQQLPEAYAKQWMEHHGLENQEALPDSGSTDIGEEAMDAS
jgi:Bromodomain